MDSSIPPEWQKWLARNAMLRLGDEEITRIMAARGFDSLTVRSNLADLRSSPCYQAGAEASQTLQKLESLLNIRRDLLRLLPLTPQLERRREVRRGDFLARYYARNTPVILLDLAESWPARSLWSLDYFEEQLGNEAVEIMANREADGAYERQVERHRQKLYFREYIQSLRATASSNDRYLVANNNLFDSPAGKRLLDDIVVPEEYLTPETSGSIFLWLGPAGTITPLHHDILNILIVQVLGRKRFSLFDPLHTLNIYNDEGVFSAVDMRQPDTSRFPLFDSIEPIEFVLEPGDALFIPVGWWHHVESLDLSASVSFTNFVFPNTYTWRHPDPKRL